MNSLGSMLQRNKDFAAQQSAAGTNAFASAGYAECEGHRHRLR
jgi:hypothetical protein